MDDLRAVTLNSSSFIYAEHAPCSLLIATAAISDIRHECRVLVFRSHWIAPPCAMWFRDSAVWSHAGPDSRGKREQHARSGRRSRPRFPWTSQQTHKLEDSLRSADAAAGTRGTGDRFAVFAVNRLLYGNGYKSWLPPNHKYVTHGALLSNLGDISAALYAACLAANSSSAITN